MGARRQQAYRRGPMSSQSSRATVVFSCLGRLYIYPCTAIFFVIVLSLESVSQRPYHELIELWTLGSLMVGVLALRVRLGMPYSQVSCHM